MSGSLHSEAHIPEELDRLLEELEETLAPRQPPLFGAGWFFSNLFILFLSLSFLVLLSAVGGVWKQSSLPGGKWPPTLSVVGSGRWDSYDYKAAEVMQERKAGHGVGDPSSEGEGGKGTEPLLGLRDQIGSEAGLQAHAAGLGGSGSAAPGHFGGEEEIFSVGPSEVKGRCGFEEFEPTGNEAGVRTLSGTMASYGSLYRLFQAAKIERSQGAALLKAMEKLLDVTKVRAEDHFRLHIREADNSVWFLELRRSETTIFHFLRSSEGGIDAHKVIFPTRREWSKVGGIVQGSLFRSVERAGLDGSIVNFFVEVLGPYIDFEEDTREGDIFKVIVSSQWIGKRLVSYDQPQAIYYRGAKVGEHIAIFYPPDSPDGRYYKPNGMSLKQIISDVPLRKIRITSPFDMRRLHPVLKVVRPHTGTDLGAPTGTPVYAFADGVVKKAKFEGAMGNMVEIVHGGGVVTFYGHLHGFAKGIKSGVRVKRGDLIGYVGTTGRSTGPHLHFAMKRGGYFVDPMKYLSVKTTKEEMINPTLQAGFLKRARTLLAILESISLSGKGRDEKGKKVEKGSTTVAPSKAKSEPSKGEAVERRQEHLRWDEEWR